MRTIAFVPLDKPCMNTAMFWTSTSNGVYANVLDPVPNALLLFVISSAMHIHHGPYIAIYVGKPIMSYVIYEFESWNVC